MNTEKKTLIWHDTYGQKWNGYFWENTSLREAGQVIYLGHTAGICPRYSEVNENDNVKEITLMDVDGTIESRSSTEAEAPSSQNRSMEKRDGRSLSAILSATNGDTYGEVRSREGAGDKLLDTRPRSDSIRSPESSSRVMANGHEGTRKNALSPWSDYSPQCQEKRK